MSVYGGWVIYLNEFSDQQRKVSAGWGLWLAEWDNFCVVTETQAEIRMSMNSRHTPTEKLFQTVDTIPTNLQVKHYDNQITDVRWTRMRAASNETTPSSKTL